MKIKVMNGRRRMNREREQEYVKAKEAMASDGRTIFK